MRKYLLLLIIGFVLSIPKVNAKDYTWEPFGYTVDGYVPIGASPVKSTVAAACNMAASLLGQPQRACFSEQSLSNYCVPSKFPCGEDYRWTNSDSAVDVLPVCSNWPYSKTPLFRGAAGRSGFDVLKAKCSCFGFGGSQRMPSLRPDFDTPYCYPAPQIQVEVSRFVYKPSEAGIPVKLAFFALSNTDVVVKTAVIQASIYAEDGAPGKLSPLVMNSDGYYIGTYTFPDFTKKRADKITVTCDICSDDFNPSTFEIKMSPTLVGFFNGVGNTEYQANAGLKALATQTEGIRAKASVK